MDTPIMDRLLVVEVTPSVAPGEHHPYSPEVIDLGFVLLACARDTGRWNVTEHYGRVLLTPRFKLSPKMQAETGLTEETLRAEGVPYENAMRGLRREFPFLRQTPWASWGPSARNLLFRMGLDRARPTWMQVVRGTPLDDVAYPFCETFFDARALFAVQFQTLPNVSVAEALVRYGCDPREPSTKASDRAFQTARVFLRLLNRENVVVSGPLPHDPAGPRCP